MALESAGDLVFGDFRLDPSEQRLWRGEEALPVRPKLFAVLRYLVENPGRLVTREELLRAVWGRVHVDETLLRGAMRDLRTTLQDEAEAPRYIETVPHRGYRFLAEVASRSSPAGRAAPTSRSEPGSLMVQRQDELAQLRAWLKHALSGRRQVVFVSGEAGIGKSTLVDNFTANLSNSDGVLVGRGQCVEQYGASEAYLPVLEALGRMCRQRGARRVLAVLHQYAPTWLVQMPSLLTDAEHQAVQRKSQNAGRERMLREMAEALEALAAETPVALLFEDLHWSDRSTLDLIGMLARRREAARLMIVSTYRPAEVIVSAHPLRALRQDLRAQAQCEELPLGFLSEPAVLEYLAMRFNMDSHDPSLERLARTVHARTDGNPLFMVNIAQYLIAQGVLTPGERSIAGNAAQLAGGVPEGLKQLIERQLERLSGEDQRLLEAASVAGSTFSVAAVAASLEESADQIDERCEDLVIRNQFLEALATRSAAENGGAVQYQFRHALYHQVLYERLPSGRRARLHRRIAEQEEALHGTRAAGRAAQLAMHFERAQEFARAVPYLKQAAQNALRRNAFQEAIALMENALRLLSQLPATPQRMEQELALKMLLCTPLITTKGYAVPEVAQLTAQARELSEQLPESPELLPALISMMRFYFVRAQLDDATALGERCVRLAESAPGAPHLIANGLMGCIRYSRGELLEARLYTQRCMSAYDVRQHGAIAVLWGDDPGIMSTTFDSVILWATGYPDQARQRIEQALVLADQVGIPYCKGFALVMAAWIYLYLEQTEIAGKHLDELVRLATEHDFKFLLAQSIGLRGWVVMMQGVSAETAVELIEKGLQAQAATGVAIGRPRMLCSLAEALAHSGQTERALAVIDEAISLTSGSGQRFDVLQALRVKGDLLLVHARKKKSRSAALEASAEECFRQAIAVCRAHSAKMLELRATVSLCRLWQRQGKLREASEMLSAIYGWFTEGFDTASLRHAMRVLEEIRAA